MDTVGQFSGKQDTLTVSQMFSEVVQLVVECLPSVHSPWFSPQHQVNLVCCHVPIIPTLRKQGQEGFAESEASLGYIIRHRLRENVWGCSVETRLETPVVMCLLYPRIHGLYSFFLFS